MTVTQQDNNSTGARVANQATAPEQAHNGAAPPNFSFDDEHLFSSIDEDALFSSAPLLTSGTTTSTIVGTADDLFSSPDWTDPSPALTTSMSFNMESCDTSPLLTDLHEAPELAGVPLFGGDQFHFSSLVQQNNNHHQTQATDASDASLSASDKRSPQMAFNRVKQSNEQSALLLLRAFNNHALFNSGTASPAIENTNSSLDNAQQATASPAAILSPLPPASLASPATPAMNIGGAPEQAQRTTARPHKRRIEAADLLPLDAPIQTRSYKTPSATSRKSSTSLSDQARNTPDLESANNGDPLASKRLSNTLAARRSRHRKAEELRQLHDTIEDLQTQVETWKRRCMRAEEERDQALGRV